MENMVNRDFWKNKRVFITGHTGFKGAWLSLWLHNAGAHIYGYALDPPTSPSLYEIANVSGIMKQDTRRDLSDLVVLRETIHDIRPEIVFHLAAQPLVRKSYSEPIETFSTNVMGTAHLLDSMRGLDSVKIAVMVTTDKVYRNNEWHRPCCEDDILGGHDPYSASKAACEIVIESYRQSFLSDKRVAVGSARAGNVIGGGDWSEDRLIPDAIRAWQKGESLYIRNSQAVRPWQHVLEPLSGYINLAQCLWFNPELAGPYNFGPSTDEVYTVRTVVDMAKDAYGSGDVQYGVNPEGPYETGYLALESSKARQLIGFQPVWSLDEAVRRTMYWYRSLYQGSDARSLCYKDIADYEVAL